MARTATSQWCPSVDAPEATRLHPSLGTGAGITLLNRRLAELLTLSIEAGRRVEIEVANGMRSDAFVHRVRIGLFNRVMTVDAAFCPAWDTQNLLGMRRLFDQFVLASDDARSTMYFDSP